MSMDSSFDDNSYGFPVWSGLAALVVWLCYKYWTRTFNFFKQSGVPHERPIPVFGNSHRLLSMGREAYDQMALKKFGKVYGLFNGMNPQFVVADLDKVGLILIKNFDAFPNRPFAATQEQSQRLSLVTLQGNHWKRIRKTVSPTFSAGKLKLMTWKMNRCVDNLLNQLSVSAKIGENVDIMKASGNLTMDTISSVAFGIVIDSHTDKDAEFVQTAKEFLRQSFNVRHPLLILDTFFPLLGKLARLLGFRRQPLSGMEFFKNIVDAAMQKRLDESQTSVDFLQLMTNAHLLQEQEPSSTSSGENHEASDSKEEIKGLTKDEVLAQGFVFFIAGYETTAKALSYACYNMAMNQDCQIKLRQEIADAIGDEADITYDDLQKLPYAKQVLEETMRLQTIAPRTGRLAAQDIDIDGLFIPAGTPVIVPISAIHHDPEIYPEPFKFDPDRFSPEEKAKRHPCSYLPFGLGPRNCIGMRLALVEAQIALARIIRSFKLEPCDETEANLEFNPSALLLSPKRSIKLRFTKLDV